MILQPSFVTPNNGSGIQEGNGGYVFSLKAATSGEILINFFLEIWDETGSNLIFKSVENEAEIYNGDVFNFGEVRYSAYKNYIEPGKKYTWRAKMRAPRYKGIIVSQGGNRLLNVPANLIPSRFCQNVTLQNNALANMNNIYIDKNLKIEEGMYLKIDIPWLLDPQIIYNGLTSSSEIISKKNYLETSTSTYLALTKDMYNSRTGEIILPDSLVWLEDVPTGTSCSIVADFLYTPFYSFKVLPAINIFLGANPISQNDSGVITNSTAKFYMTTNSSSVFFNIKYYIFNFYTQQGELLHSSGKIFNSSLSYQMENLSEDVYYKVEGIICTQENFLYSQDKLFSVQLEKLKFSVPVNVEYDESSSCAVITWEQTQQSFPVESETGFIYVSNDSYNDYKSIILNDSSLTYNTINNKDIKLSDNSTILMSTLLFSTHTDNPTTPPEKILEIGFTPSGWNPWQADNIPNFIVGCKDYKIILSCPKKDKDTNNFFTSPVSYELYDFFDETISCFQDEEGANLENKRYYLNKDEIWDNDKIFCVNDYNDFLNSRFKIALIPSQILDDGLKENPPRGAKVIRVKGDEA